MSPNIISTCGFRTALLGSVAGTLALAVLPGQALAATATEIVITGSRIPQANLITTSPVTQIGSEDVNAQGVTKIDDLTNQLPNVFAGQNATISNGASGSATVNLRGLGSSRTLVLIDGKRMVYGNPGTSAADLNQIPAQLVDRIEVLTGGASAIYGSDALSGVVNFIMKKDYEGLQLDAQFSFFQHHNDYDGPGYLREVIAARAATNPSQFALPKRDVTDGYGRDVSAILGTATADNRGHVEAYFTWNKTDEVLQGNRDYSECALGAQSAAPVAGVPAGAIHWTCGGSSTSMPGRFTDFATYNFTVDSGGVVPGYSFRAFSAALDQYNYGPSNHYQRPSERYGFGTFGSYDITPGIEIYAQLMFSDYQTKGQIAPSGDFFSTSTISCGNPMLSPLQAGGIGCTTAQINASATFDQTGVGADVLKTMYIGRRNVEGGGRQDDLEYATYRTVVGFRGAAWEGWDYDLSAQYSKVILSRTYLNDFSVTRLNRALDVIDTDPTPGVTAVCRSFADGTDPNCVPWNIFGLAGATGGSDPNDPAAGTALAIVDGLVGGPSAAALAYLQVPLTQRAYNEQRVVTGAVTGDLGPWGVKSPWADESFKAAFGFEVRRDNIHNVVDENFATGNASGQGGPTIGLDGATDLWELFTEVRMPMVENVWLAKLISVDAAFRYSSYDTQKQVNTYKIGADWAPTDDIRFRASFQHATRAANIIDLFSAQGLGLFDMAFDPCDDLNDDGIVNGSVPAACFVGPAGSTVTLAQSTGGALNSPAGQYQALFGGNPALNPEAGNTYTIGFVLTPTMVPGLIATVDWFSIKVSNAITSVLPNEILDACYSGVAPGLCTEIHRNATGQLWIPAGGAGFVDALNTNIGGVTTKGVDVSALYTFDFADMGWANVGSLNVSMFGTWLDTLLTDFGIGTSNLECAGFYGPNDCGSPNPEWRHRLRLTWDTPWHFDVSGTWRYYGSVEDQTAAASYLAKSWDAENYFDLSGNLHLTKSAVVRLGVNNILDNDPNLAIVGAGTNGNGNTYPQTYDSLGRYIFMGLTIDM